MKKNKSIKWCFNYFLIGFINNLRSYFKDKNNNAYRAYKASREPKVITINPDGWESFSEMERLEQISESLLENKLIMQK
jgi:hypothetical protein